MKRLLSLLVVFAVLTLAADASAFQPVRGAVKGTARVAGKAVKVLKVVKVVKVPFRLFGCRG